jgi:acyl-coenzyme A thioesterase PaaI-like protein
VAEPVALEGEQWDGALFGPGAACYGCAPHHPHGLRLRFRREGELLSTAYQAGPEQQGPPGIMHGGLVATLADELGAWAVIVGLGKFGFTTTLQARYHQAVRAGLPLRGEARLPTVARRLVDVPVRLYQEERLVFSSDLQFAVLGRAAAEQLLGGPLPEAWARWVR